MADPPKVNPPVVIGKPGLVAFGEGLVPDGTDITTSLQHESVVQISCGDGHSAVVCQSGRVYIFGKTEGDTEPIGPRLVSFPSSVRITQADCGAMFTVFLADTGNLYSSGANKYGQLGLGRKINIPMGLPVLVPGLSALKKVAAGYYHTVALTISGEVWGTGNNGYGQLGLGHMKDQTTFTRLPNLPEHIVDISSSGHHTSLITKSQLLICGLNNYGQLGRGEVKTKSSIIKTVSLPSTAVAKVSCGYHHTVALGADGTAWAWGLNANGQLGTDVQDNRSAPTKMAGLENQTISEVIGGYEQTAILTRDGEVLMCGNGGSGQLGLGMENLLTPTLIPKSPGLVVKQVAFTKTYSLLLVVPKLSIGTDTKKESDITDWEKHMMKSLECPVCFKIMSTPIHQCINGHSLCGSCRSNHNTTVCPVCRGHFIAGRCIALESLSENVKLPCTDCLERMPVRDLQKHAEVCLQRNYVCPLQPALCGWSGRADKILAHASSAHPDQTWTDLPHLFVHSLTDAPVQTDLLVAHGQIFTLRRRFDRQANAFQTGLRYIGPPENARKFVFKFTIMLDNIKNNYHRNVCSDHTTNTFQSSNCLTIKNDVFNTFLQQDRLVCQVAILKMQATNLADQIKELLGGGNRH